MTDLHRLHAMFDELVELPPERWPDWFDSRGLDTRTRSELERLLAADRDSAGLLDRSIGHHGESLALEAEEARVPDPIGRRIGSFRIVKRLGQGGMATVFLAVRDGADFEQHVALKLLRRDAFDEIDLAMFRRERQVLARLSHPNIARLIDGGVGDDGIPYLAMEYVDGIAITRWCRERALGVGERVALLAKVARAVAAAHAALVVHRDIKPSNVLVGADGEPRLLDFGIAKLLHAGEGDTTQHGTTPMTPEYAAPEQFAGGPITTATDVYALGVLMYEVLAGVRPERVAPKPPSVALAAGRSSAGASSSSATRRVRQDLDKIVLMAIAEEPARRYPGAAAFADDLDRHLADQPVAAHPPSAWYRARKFAQRHRGGVAVTALLVVGILASLALALWQARVARDEATRANVVRDYIVDLLRRTTPDRPEAERPDIPTLVYTAASTLPDDLRDQPEVRTELLYTLGTVLRHMRDFPRSEALLREAVANSASMPVDARLRVAASVELSRTLLRRNDAAGAAAQLAPVLALPASRLPDDIPRGMLLKLSMAIEMYLGHRDRALPLAEQTIAAYRRDCDAGVRCAELAFAESDVGQVMLGAVDVRRARELLESALVRKRATGAPPISIAQTLTVLSYVAFYQGELDRSEALVREAERLLLALGDGLSQRPIAQREQLAELHIARQAPEAALPLLETMLADQVSTEVSPCALAGTHLLIARAQVGAKRSAAALASAERVATSAAACGGNDKVLNVPLAALLRGRALAADAAREEAAAAYELEMTARDRFTAAGTGRQLLVHAEAMRLAHAIGRDEEAQHWARALVDLLERIDASPRSPLRFEAESLLGATAPPS